MIILEKQKDEFWISISAKKLDILMIHNFLTNEPGWSNGISFQKVKKSIHNSWNFGIYFKQQQIGYARVISGFSTIAYLGRFLLQKNIEDFNLVNDLWKQ